MLLTLPSWAPTRVLLPGVLGASRTRPSSVQKQRKASFSVQSIQRCELVLPSTRPWAGLLYRALVSREGLGVLPGGAQLCSSQHSLQSQVPGAALLHTACRRHLGLQCPVQCLSARAPPPPSWIAALCAALLRTARRAASSGTAVSR